MTDNQGWISLHRELLNKSIWVESTPEQKTILITLLLMVNHAPNKWEWKGTEYVLKSGQVITSLESIANKSGKGVSIQNVRTALKRFEKLGFLTNESTKRNRLITIVNYGFYQGKEEQANKATNSQLTISQQTANNQLTTNNNVNNANNVNNVNKDILSDKSDDTPYKEIIEYLNQKANTNFRASGQKTRTLIKARYKEGFNLDDFKKVIDTKVGEWSKSDMEKYLRPETLFGPKFEGYLNQPAHQSNQMMDYETYAERFSTSAKKELDLNLYPPMDMEDLPF